MADWPIMPQLAPNIVTNFEYDSIKVEHVAINGSNAATAWASANEAIYVPFRLPIAVRITELFWANGGTIAGTNADLGIFRDDGVKVVSTGSTALSGASQIQKVNITDTDLPPGRYYMGFALSTNTATVQLMTYAAAVEARILGICAEASALALPSTATFATTTRAYSPMCGMTIGRVQ